MERAVPLRNWPQPGCPSDATVVSNDSGLHIRYPVAEAAGGGEALVRFPLPYIFKLGAPNDEALGGHPLYGNGLTFYTVHRVDESSWIAALERQNSVHDRHNRTQFLENKVHYIITLEDSTLECVVTEGESKEPQVMICASPEEADRLWNEQIRA